MAAILAQRTGSVSLLRFSNEGGKQMAGLHLIYMPADEARPSDTVLDIIESDDPNDVLLEVKANPGSIAMELDAEDYEDIPYKLRELGF
jgi:hypothetical protein